MSAKRSEPLDYERVRSALAERGYLGGRVERFVLQGWSQGTGRPPRLIRSALKAALLGAPVLALLVAATVARDNRPLIAARDFPLIWAYFTPLCALALFALDATVGWVSVQLAERMGLHRGEVTRAALLAGIPTVAYLLVLGRSGRSSQGLAIEAAYFALGVVVVVFVSWLAGLVSVAGILGRTGRVAGRRGRSLRTLFVIMSLAMLALTVVRLDRGRLPEGPSGATWPEFETVAAERLLFIGIDGIDGEWIEALEPTGAADRLLELMATGTVIPLHRASQGEPPEVWISMLTGTPGPVHGVRRAGAERFPGVATPLNSESGRLPFVRAMGLLIPSTTVPTSGAVRQVRTAWEIHAQRRRALSVGWWGSWPATGAPGTNPAWVVSDRVLAKLLSAATFDRDTWPEALYERLGEDFAANRDRFRADFDATFQAHAAAAAKLAWESYLIDAFHASTARSLWDEAAIESAFLYLPGLEILRHRVEKANLPLLQKATLFEAYTRWLGDEVAALFEMAGRDSTVVVVTDPGRVATGDAEGFAIVRGAGAAPGCVETTRDSLAVTPLLLALGGFPASEELPELGRMACLESISTASETISSYGRRPLETSSPGSAYDEEMVERLRSLGYLN